MEELNKIRIRSDEELKIQNIGLLELNKILNDKKIKHFVTGGTLLGAIREKNFIKWDWDAEFTILTDEVFSKKNELNDLFVKSGFKIIGFSFKYDTFKWELEKYNFVYELIGLYREGEWLYRKGRGTKVPAFFFDKPTNLFFLGNLYQTVSDPEKYLEFCYGDWETPKRTIDKKEYLTTEYQPRFKTYNIFFQKIINIFIKFKKIFN